MIREMMIENMKIGKFESISDDDVEWRKSLCVIYHIKKSLTQIEVACLTKLKMLPLRLKIHPRKSGRRENSKCSCRAIVK